MNTARFLIVSRTSFLLAVACLLVTAGCASKKPGLTRGKVVPWTVQVAKQSTASIRVDILGVNQPDDPYWRRGVKPDDYWKENSPIRRQTENRIRTTTFENGAPLKLEKTDPIWEQWSKYGTFELMVIADLPGKYSNDESDPRRVFLPLGKKEWLSKNLEIEVLDSQIRVLTPKRP